LLAEDKSVFQLINSEVSNNKNLQLTGIGTEISFINTSFSEIENTNGAFLTIYAYSTEGAILTLENNRFE